VAAVSAILFQPTATGDQVGWNPLRADFRLQARQAGPVEDDSRKWRTLVAIVFGKLV